VKSILRTLRSYLPLTFLALLTTDSLPAQSGDLFRLPLNQDTAGHFYVDHNAAANQCLVWHGGNSCTSDPLLNNTYDGHRGTDFSTVGTGAEIRATATGWLIGQEDGHGPGYDCASPPNGNFVRLYHGNGISTVYLHMLKDTVTTVELYERIECGDIIGQVGQSGCATGPHLHFEAQQNGTYFDPFEGESSPTSESWWVSQGDGSPAIQCADNTWEFESGTCVGVQSEVNVRPAAGGTCNGGCPSKGPGSSGSIIGGPEGATLQGQFYVWWQVRWDDGLEGWSIEGPLDKVSCNGGPSSLNQLSASGAVLPVGSTTNAGTVKFQGRVSSPEGKALRLEVEVRETSQPFMGIANKASTLVSSGSEPSVCLSGLADGSYHWQARTMDEDGKSSPWISYGGNSEVAADFQVQANQCAICLSNGNAMISPLTFSKAACSPQLSVALSTQPSSGQAPLNNVDLTATLSNSSTESATYTFYCDRSDAGTDITPGYVSRSATTASTKTVLDACDYPTLGTYTAKIIVEQGSNVAEGRKTITVGSTPAPQPTVSTQQASGISNESAILNLSVNPNGTSTTVWFRWGETQSLLNSTGSLSAGSGTTNVSRSLTLTTLTCDRTYFFQANAQNSQSQSAAGDILSFRTLDCGGGGSDQQSDLIIDPGFEEGDFGWWVASPDFHISDNNPGRERSGSYYAYLSDGNDDPANNLDGGVITPDMHIPANATGAELRFWISISTQETIAAEFDKLEAYILDQNDNPILLRKLSNLNHSGTTYFLVTKAISSTYFGQDVQVFLRGTTDASLPTVFRIDDVSLLVTVPSGGPPTDVTTLPADQVTSSSARLNMSLNPNAAETDVWWDLEANDSSPDDETQAFSVGSDPSTINARYTALGLQCDTRYYMRGNASNDYGTDNGQVLSFWTDPCPGSRPNANTGAADNITETSGRLTAEVNPNGSITDAWFNWSASTSLGNATPKQTISAGTGYVGITQNLSNLTCSTTYYFRVEAENDEGSDNGTIRTFTTDDCPGGPTQGDFLLWAERQSCDGNQAAILLRWSPVQDASTTYTVRRLDGGYLRNVDTSIEGYADLVTTGFQYGEAYDFEVIASDGSGTLSSNVVRVHIVDQECIGAGGEAESPGPFISWSEPFTCQNGNLAIELHWSESAGAESYTIERFAESGGVARTVSNLTSTSYLDSTELAPGLQHVWKITAYNEYGSTESQFMVYLYTPSGSCGESSIPGPFTVTASAPTCIDNEPAIPISFTPSSGADKFYSYYVYGQASSLGGGSLNTDILGFNYNVTAGVKPAQVHEIGMYSEDPQDEFKKRFSNSVFVYVPHDICGDSALAPSALTQPASAVTSDSAILRSRVRANGSPTTVSFQWGKTTSYGNSTPGQEIGSSTLVQQRPSMQVTGLACETEYHYRVVGQNAVGTAFGSDASFVTGDCGPCGVPDLYLTNLSITDLSTYQACNSISAGIGVSVESGGELRLAAPHIVFENGFTVKAGGSFRAGPSLTSGPPSGAATVFADDFDDNTIDPIKWPQIEGYSVTETNGQMEVTADVTDDYGILGSEWFEIDPTKPFTIQRMVRMHYANDYLRGYFRVLSETDPDWFLLVGHYYYAYQSGNSCSAFGTYVGIRGAPTNCARVAEGKVSPGIATQWNQWFHEAITYDPATGAVEYFRNGESMFVWLGEPLPTTGSPTERLKLEFRAAGWYTGHEHFLDDLFVWQ